MEALNSRSRFRRLLTPGNLFALIVLLGSVGVFLWLRAHPELNAFSEEGLQTLVRSLGWRGPVVYAALVALSVVVSQLPGVPLALAAGAVWGPLAAGVYSVIGGFIGGMIAYFLGRTLGRSVMRALAGKVIVFNEARGERYLGGLIFISRMLPVLSFDLISYAAGVTGLSLPLYALATFFGMIPSTFLLTYLGSAFTVSAPLALSLSGVAVVVLLVLPWLIRRYNLLGLRDSVRFE